MSLEILFYKIQHFVHMEGDLSIVVSDRIQIGLIFDSFNFEVLIRVLELISVPNVSIEIQLF